MSNLHDAGARELLELWALLDADDRMRLLGFAKRLIECATFIGGPFDGWPVDAGDREHPFITFSYTPGLMAVYEIDDRDRFMFVDIRPNDDIAERAEIEPGEYTGPSPWDDENQGGANHE